MAREPTFIRLEPAVKRALEDAAAGDGRSLSSLINKILTDWIADRELAQRTAPRNRRPKPKAAPISLDQMRRSA